jgi:hypothetical protein
MTEHAGNPSFKSDKLPLTGHMTLGGLFEDEPC